MDSKNNHKDNVDLKTDEIIEQLNLTISPESLEDSKAISILSDNLTLKTNDLLGLKEFLKSEIRKESLVDALKKCPYVELSEENEKISIVIDENITIFSILNFPPKISKDEVISSLSLNNMSNYRLFKKSVYWKLVTNDKEAVEHIVEKLNSLTYDNTKVKYDVTNKSQLLRVIQKQLQASNYQKESNDLKADNIKRSAGKETSQRTNSDALSWRKKSNDASSVVSNGESEKFFNRNKGKENENKRERFNSDGFTPSKFISPPFNYTRGSRFEEIEIDISNIKYSLTIKHQYSLNEMNSYYELLKTSKAFDCLPKFNNEIHVEIVNAKAKDLPAFGNCPKTNYNYVNSRRASDFTGASNFKIPKSNPLCNIPKTFNKFDAVPQYVNQPSEMK